MKKVEVSPQLRIEDVLSKAHGQDVILTQNGHAVALLSEMDDDELYWYERESDPAFIESIARARKDIGQGNIVSHQDLLSEFK